MAKLDRDYHDQVVLEALADLEPECRRFDIHSIEPIRSGEEVPTEEDELGFEVEFDIYRRWKFGGERRRIVALKEDHEGDWDVYYF